MRHSEGATDGLVGARACPGRTGPDRRRGGAPGTRISAPAICHPYSLLSRSRYARSPRPHTDSVRDECESSS